MKTKKIAFAAAGLAATLIISFFTFAGIRSVQFKNETGTKQLTLEQQQSLHTTLLEQYGQNYEILKPLPYKIEKPKLPVGAESAIIIDTSNGNILYEKNADQVIPPASMTKLFAMYVTEEEVRAGRLSYDEIIPLPSECWACNMPPHSSLMFLGQGQKVTLAELLTGLSVCSGNDAAYALAYKICGNMEDFVERMNSVAMDLGLTHTHFVESSGYSEQNTTTAREMAAFCRVYLQNHPQSLARFHSVPSFTYPKAHNLAPGDTLQAQDFSAGLPSHITMSITQKNTNPLLDRLPGCDGLKTGYIDESGYNLSLTAIRGSTRFLSVTMKGQGANAAQGQAGRVADGTALMEWAFSSFIDFADADDGDFADDGDLPVSDGSDFVDEGDLSLIKPHFVKIYGVKGEKSLNLVPAFDVKSVTVPNVYGDVIADNLEFVRVVAEVPDFLEGEVLQGQPYGSIKIYLKDYLLQEVPLVADRSLERAGGIVRMVDKIIK